METTDVILDISARHVHIRPEDVETLFGRPDALTLREGHKSAIGGEEVFNERVEIVGPKGSIKNVTIIGPLRNYVQAEVSMTDTRALGIEAVIKKSGDHEGTPGIEIVGPCGSLKLDRGCIVARRHVHMQELLDFMFLFASTAGGVMADIPGIDFYRGGTKGYSSGTAVIIGGVDKDGNDATNDLSFMLLDAMAQTRMCSPWPTVRWHDGTPYELKIKTVEVMRCGTGHPKILNDNVCIEAFRRYGVPLEEARDYVLDPTKTRVKGAKLILVPTTAGTGSDVTNALIIAVSSKGAKIGIGGKELYSDISLLDPLLTLSLPRKQTASTAMDAFSHCVESMLSAISNPICDILSLEGIRLVVNNIEKVMENGNDVETRQNIMLAAYLGGMSLNDGACNFGHALAHTLGAEYRIPHGELCAVALPMVIEYFAEIFPEKIRKIAKAMGLEPPASASNAEIAAITADAVRALRARLGLSKFSDFAFGYEDLPRLSEMIMGDTCIGALRISVPNHEVTPEDFLIPMQKEYNRE